MLALAVSYEIQCRFTGVVPVMAKGFNHATQLAISAAASAAKLFGLSAGGIANAISIATADNVSLACIHVEPVSQWKLFSRADGDASGIRSFDGKTRLHGSGRPFRGPVGLGIHARPADSGQLGRSISGDRQADGPKEILLANSWTAGHRSGAGCEAQQRSRAHRRRARAMRYFPGGLRLRWRRHLWLKGSSVDEKSKATTI